jgi:hypothetical protein
MIQAVSRRPLKAETRVQSEAETMRDKMALEEVQLLILRLFPVSNNP